MRTTADGGYLVAGYKQLYVTLGGISFGDAWVLRLDRSRNVIWQRTYGESGMDEISAGQPTPDGGFVMAGSRRAIGYVLPQLRVLKIDVNGAVVWTKRFGGTGGEGASSVQATADGGYVVAGNTRSFGAGDSDAWVLKLDANGAIPGCPYMVDADAIVADSDATTASSTVTAVDANATQASGMANATDSTGVVFEQCRYE